MGRETRRSRSKSPSAAPGGSRRRGGGGDRDVRENRDRERDRDRYSRRKRSRSRERDRRRHSSDRRFSRSRSLSSSVERTTGKKSKEIERPIVTDADLQGKTPDEQEMMKMMGFCNFDTTKNKKVGGNEVGNVHVILKRKYRQYMNRKGGFNRPLDFVA